MENNQEEHITPAQDKCESYEDLPVLEEIFLKYGYGPITLKTFFLVFIILSLEGVHLTYFGSLFIPIQKFYELTDNEMQIYSSLIFITVGLGSFSCGYLSDKFQRVHILLFFQFVVALSHFLIGTYKNIIFFTVLRAIIGYSLGIITPLSINLLTESLPIRFRAIALILVWLGFAIGQVFLLTIMLFIMPNFEVSHYPMTIMISSSLSFFSFILTLLFLKDSPRNLIINKQEDEAMEILEKLNGGKIDEELREKIIQQTKTGINEDLNVSIKELFHGELLRTSLLLTFIWLLNSVVNFGPFLITSLTMKGIGIEEAPIGNREIIIKQMWIACLGTTSNFLGGLLCESSYLGRNKANMLSSFGALIFSVCLFTIRSNFEILFGLYGAFAGMSFNITSTYSCEIIPTKIRDLAMGYFFFITRFGGFFSQILYLYLHHIGLWVPYHTTTALVGIYIILVFFLPIDTYHRPLDTEIKPRHSVTKYHRLDDETSATERLLIKK
jgi:MFS family permease